ncbi:MAG TPA: inositol monophosphatase [Usitatibacter sp.]|nr:inositol monophosphatase [Usitatibacter sp.]
MDITVHFAARAIEAVRRVAAEEILPRYRNLAPFGGTSPVSRKDDGSIVTEADFAAQRELVRRLHSIDPVPVMGEEMPSHEQVALFESSPRFWCVDPLDGTKNFSQAVPFFAVSVALMEGSRPLFGTIYDPIADEAFYAVQGAGAWLNHRPLRVPSRGPSLERAVAEVSLRRDTARLRGALKRHKPYARRLTSGSSALSWCHLAAARTDVMLHSGQKMWDYAAGSLILAESGGYLSALEDDDYWKGSPWSRSVIAARTEPLLIEWRRWIREHLAT